MMQYGTRKSIYLRSGGGSDKRNKNEDGCQLWMTGGEGKDVVLEFYHYERE